MKNSFTRYCSNLVVFVLLSWGLARPFVGVAQQVAPKSVLGYNASVDSVAEKLVALALEGPRMRELKKTAEASYWNYKRAKTAWANNVVLSLNLNEFTFQQTFGGDDPIGNRFYPRYNFSVGLPLGLVMNNPKFTKSTKATHEVDVATIDGEKRAIRRRLLVLYESYLHQRQLLTIQQSLLIDAKKNTENQEKRFREGKITFEVYVASTRNYNQEILRELEYSKDLKQIEIQIEELIGMELEDALLQFQ
jgi:outer membrane protein TolC